MKAMRMFDGRSMAFVIEGMALRMLAFSGKKIESWYSVPLNGKSVSEGVVASPDIVGGMMAEAIAEHGLPRRGVVCALPSLGSATQTLTLPDVKKGGLADMVKREIRRTMPSSQDVDFVHWEELPAQGILRQKRIYTLAVPRNTVLGMAGACSTAGVTLKGMELKPFALLRAVRCEEGIIVHCEVDSIEVVVVSGGFPALFRAIPVKDPSPTPEMANQNLLRELPFTIDYYNRSNYESQLSPEAPVYMCGELALDPQLAMGITAAIGREAVGVEPMIECPPNFPVAQFLTCVGLMLREKW
jgi:hypothetical protein